MVYSFLLILSVFLINLVGKDVYPHQSGDVGIFVSKGSGVVGNVKQFHTLIERTSLVDSNKYRLFFLPTAYTIGLGRGYFEGMPLFFIGAGIGITDWLQIEGRFIGFPTIFADLQGEFKMNLSENRDKGLNMALGGIISLGVIGEDESKIHFTPFITFSKHLNNKATCLHFGMLAFKPPITFNVLITEKNQFIMPFFGIEQSIKSSFLVMGTNLYKLMGEAIFMIERDMKIILLGGVKGFYKRVTVNVGLPLPSITFNFQLW